MLDMSERLDGDFISAIANECKDLGIYAAVGVDLRGKVGRRIDRPTQDAWRSARADCRADGQTGEVTPSWCLPVATASCI